MKKVIITVIITIVLGLGAVFVTSSFLFGNKSYFYTQIDNSKYTVSHQRDNTYYSYVLTSYDENGNERELKFDTLRELRNSAYLKLKTAAVGVLDWEEVQWAEIPDSAREKLSE